MSVLHERFGLRMTAALLQLQDFLINLERHGRARWAAEISVFDQK